MPPSVALRDYFRKNIWIELWEERPRLSEKPVEGTDEIALEAVLSADNIPETEKRMRGVVRVQTDQWIFGKEILADAQVLRYKYPLYQAKYLERPEFVIASKYIELSEMD